MDLGAYRGICGVVSAANLQLDLSRESVVEDQAFRDLMTQLKTYIDTVLMPKMKRDLRFMLPLQRELAKRFLDQWQRGRG